MAQLATEYSEGGQAHPHDGVIRTLTRTVSRRLHLPAGRHPVSPEDAHAMCGVAFASTLRRGQVRGSRAGSMSAAGHPAPQLTPEGAPATSPTRCGRYRIGRPAALHKGRRQCAAKHDRGLRRRGTDHGHCHRTRILPVSPAPARASSPSPLPRPVMNREPPGSGTTRC